jgi:hypothetical protein
MKKLLLISLILPSIVHANCTILAKKKKAKAKTVYVDGVSIPKKVREALKTQCDFKVSVFTKDELIQMETKAFNKKIEKIKGGE